MGRGTHLYPYRYKGPFGRAAVASSLAQAAAKAGELRRGLEGRELDASVYVWAVEAPLVRVLVEPDMDSERLAALFARYAWLIEQVDAHLERDGRDPPPRKTRQVRVVNEANGTVVVSWSCGAGDLGGPSWAAWRFDVAAAGGRYVWILGFGLDQPTREAAEAAALVEP